MKKIFLTIAMFLTLSSFAETPKTEAPLILEYNYVDTAKQVSLVDLETDKEFCCYFDVVNVYNKTFTEDTIRVIDKKTGTCLGVIFGVPNKEFIMEVYINQLQPESVKDITDKMVRN